jgi:uncharacterized protein YbjT (DUF2867 family)
MGGQIKDKTTGEEALRASGLDWTIVYPTKLTNGPKTESTVIPETRKVGMSHKISRAAAASFLLQAATDGLYSRRAVIITWMTRTGSKADQDQRLRRNPGLAVLPNSRANDRLGSDPRLPAGLCLRARRFA